MSKHTLSVLVEDKPGVLTRVAALFSRRGFNINSLAVGPTELPDISRITVVVEVEGAALEQVTKQLNKLIEVLKVVELDPHASVQREILLVKVRADPATRSQVIDTIQLFKAKVVDVTTVRPSASAFALLLLPSARPMRTSTPESRRLRACAWPWLP